MTLPFIIEYACEYGHRFDHTHMGPGETAPQYMPCQGVREEVTCPRLAERVTSAPRVKVINRGNLDFNERERERLTKRSQEWDNSKQGKDTKMEAIERQTKNKNFV